MEKRVRIIEKGRKWRTERSTVISIRDIAHPVDKTLVKTLERARVKSALNGPLEQLVSAQYGQLLATGIRLNEENFPELYGLMEDTCRQLGIQIPYTVITNELNGINAFATGTDERAFIVISNMAVKYLPPKELQFILSHECGHVAMEHMVYHTAGSLAATAGSLIPIIGPVLAQTVVFPLNFWNRCSEITADRIGLICCGDLHAAQMALLRIVGGFTDVSDIDIDRYIKQGRDLQNTQFLGKLGEYFKTHPIIHKRLRTMEDFYNSELYYQATNRVPPQGAALLTRAELDKKTDALLKIV